MKNIVIDNQGIQFPPNKTKKTHLEVQIAELQQQEQQISQQLKTWQAKAKKANNLANCLAATNKFGQQFLTNMVEFVLKFEIGREAFTELIHESIAREVESLENRLASVQSQIQHQERKFVRLQACRQGKTLLECKLNNGIGCLAVELKFAGFFENSAYLKDFRCPQCVEHEYCPEVETCEGCYERFLTSAMKEFQGEYYCGASNDICHIQTNDQPLRELTLKGSCEYQGEVNGT
ncbi:3977_t:CDS:2 [Funneliformis geosporum]|uniref:3977_t:CDS:1 n=1 Tax=Funneliformis geosporum TaxID=1117311 RepID=A0A9W4SPZ6_9GLOM|nr:3977_t:CDS:2 [Funneliformis geosporum]